MYTRPVFYKVYSIFMLIAAVLTFVSGFIMLFTPVFDIAIRSALKSAFSSEEVEAYVIVAKLLGFVFSVVLSALSLFLEFAFYSDFAAVVRHEKRDDRTTFPANCLSFSTGFLKVLGIIIFIYQAVTFLIPAIIFMVLSFRFGNAFLGIIIVVIALAVSLWYFIHYFLRFRAFDDTVKSLMKTKLTEQDKVRLLRNKPNLFRAVCRFLYGVAVAMFILPIALLIVFVFIKAENLAYYTLVATPFYWLSCIVYALSLGVVGCMYDNLAMAMEHEMIKYRLI